MGYFQQRKVPFPLADVNLRDASDTDLARIGTEMRTGLALSDDDFAFPVQSAQYARDHDSPPSAATPSLRPQPSCDVPQELA